VPVRKDFGSSESGACSESHCLFRLAAQFATKVRGVFWSLRMWTTNFFPSGVTSSGVTCCNYPSPVRAPLPGGSDAREMLNSRLQRRCRLLVPEVLLAGGERSERPIEIMRAIRITRSLHCDDLIVVELVDVIGGAAGAGGCPVQTADLQVSSLKNPALVGISSELVCVCWMSQFIQFVPLEGPRETAACH
jgi:hypothetical protein